MIYDICVLYMYNSYIIYDVTAQQHWKLAPSFFNIHTRAQLLPQIQLEVLGRQL